MIGVTWLRTVMGAVFGLVSHRRVGAGRQEAVPCLAVCETCHQAR